MNAAMFMIDVEDDDDENDDEGEPWRRAVASGNVQQLQDLIQQHGLDILGPDSDIVFLAAVQANHFGMVQYLLEHCRSVVDIDEVDFVMNGRHLRSETWSALHFAAANGNAEMIRYLMGQGFDVSARDNRSGYDGSSTPLYVAACKNQDAAFQCLLETEGCDIDGAAGDEGGDSVLLIAIKKNNLAMVQCLLEHYQKAGNVERYARESTLSLHKVCGVSGGNLEIAKYLVETCHVAVDALLENDNELHDDTNATPLLQACQSGNLGIIQYLESCGANINVTDKHGNTVLHCSAGSLDVLKYFVETHGFNIEQQNHKGETTLHCACIIPWAIADGALQYVVAQCNANVNAINDSGEICLHIASRNDCLSVAQYLLESGRVANVNAQDKNGQTPLHISCTKYGDLFERTRFWVDVAGVNVSMRDKEGKTALHVAAAAAPTDTWRSQVRTVFFLVTRFVVDDEADDKSSGMDDRSDVHSGGTGLAKRRKGEIQT